MCVELPTNAESLPKKTTKKKKTNKKRDPRAKFREHQGSSLQHKPDKTLPYRTWGSSFTEEASSRKIQGCGIQSL